ncbi:MAG: sugar ABC transporter [Lentisphaerae bacterium RIFOXYB12_FULL_65_16]|nr:MAG: sugar ABC transporter [Lentisphaerae bacterium RIFOXYA12_64_32]OGV91286.1 MAG: sugar ABC transporter [Lentisphaerae bacterium RIFOXYB12_FULL_65_16]
MGEIFFEIKGVRKRFGAVEALRNVDLTVRRGEVHALVGENGAGKSTLMKILSGAYQPDAGVITAAGQPYRVASPTEARAHGVAMIYQELNLAPHLTVAENITLGIEQTRFGFVREQRDRMRAALEMLGHAELSLDARVGELNIGTQQLVEIARALVSDARLVIMDEPTSSLSASDTEALFRVVARLTEAGVAVIYISHFLEEVKRIAQSYTVLRDGESVATGRLAAVSLREIIEKMVGRKLTEMFPRTPHTMGAPLLRVQHLRGHGSPRDVSFDLRRGEILGLAGLVGSGRSETVRALFGLEPARDGAVFLADGKPLRVRALRPRLALGAGLDLLCENRKDEGLATLLPIRANITLSSLSQLSTGGFLHGKQECRVAEDACRRLSVRCRDVEQEAVALSGGNQQKVALARILHHDSDILFLDEPTRGIDVGSKAEICQLIGRLAQQGKAIIMVSSYLPELLGVCDTLAVMHRGTLSSVLPVAEWTEESILLYATAGRMPNADEA